MVYAMAKVVGSTKAKAAYMINFEFITDSFLVPFAVTERSRISPSLDWNPKRLSWLRYARSLSDIVRFLAV